MKKIKVVAALIETNDKILIAQRLHPELNGKWEFPGGKVRRGEKDKDAIYRKILEELNISIKCDYLLCSCDYKKGDYDIEIKLYHCTYLSGEVVLKVHSSYVFVDRSLLLTYDLAPADLELAKYVLNN